MCTLSVGSLKHIYPWNYGIEFGSTKTLVLISSPSTFSWRSNVMSWFKYPVGVAYCRWSQLIIWIQYLHVRVLLLRLLLIKYVVMNSPRTKIAYECNLFRLICFAYELVSRMMYDLLRLSFDHDFSFCVLSFIRIL